MTKNQFKRLILVIVTLVVVVLMGTSLLRSLSEPQVTNRLELYQTDLLLHATELDVAAGDADLSAARDALLSENPIDTALEQYQTVRKSAQTNLTRLQAQLEQITETSNGATASAAPADISSPATEVQQLRETLQQQQELINQLDLRIGLLQAEQGKTSAALETWGALVDRTQTTSTTQSANKPLAKTASVLIGLWSEPPRILPDAEEQLQKHLQGWFRYKALAHLYQLQQRSDALMALQAAEQQTAQQTLFKLVLVGVVPNIVGLVGLVLLIILGARWFIRKPSAPAENLAWEVPWDWETILQVVVLGFFFVGQIVLPLLLGALGFNFSAFGSRAKAAYTLTYYVLMAASTLFILYLSIRPYLPLPEGWFRFTKAKRNWLSWGIGGYFAALPLMLVVSLLNQQIWQGQGGSNPLLQTVLEEGDGVALALFFFTAAIAAPIFEETLFRGFLLPSLTKYVPVWAAIILSAGLFAVAHLSLSEVLPLAVLGCVLGFIYTRSRSLLAPMLLHSLWNSVTMVGLLILGSSSS